MKEFLGLVKLKLSCLRFEAKQVICGSKCVRIGYNFQILIMHEEKLSHETFSKSKIVTSYE